MPCPRKTSLGVSCSGIEGMPFPFSVEAGYIGRDAPVMLQQSYGAQLDEPLMQLKKSRSNLALREDNCGCDVTVEEEHSACIQGLPQDIMLDILSRLPWASSFSLRHVSRAWRRAASSDALHQARVARDALEQWLFVLPELPRGGPFRAFDSKTATWHTLPPIPVEDPAALEGFACAAAANKLLVIGGSEKTISPSGTGTRSAVTSRVWQFDAMQWRWTKAPAMGTARAWASAAVVGDRHVYVTGGQGSSSFLKSAEVYDVVNRVWRDISPMHMTRCSHRAIVVEGKVLVVAGELERHDLAQATPVGHRGPDQAPVPLGVRDPPSQLLGARDQHHRQHPRQQQPQLQSWPPHDVLGGTRGRTPVAAPEAPGAGLRDVAALPLQTRTSRGGMEHASVEVYDEESDEWVMVPNSWMNGAKVPCPVALVKDQVYAIHHSTVHVWDKELGMWHVCGETPGRDAYARPLQVSGFECTGLNGGLVLFGGTKNTWSSKSRLTQQHLSSVYTWDPHAGLPEETTTTTTGLNGRLTEHSTLRAPSDRHNRIMLWKELPPMVGGSGQVLASAVLKV